MNRSIYETLCEGNLDLSAKGLIRCYKPVNFINNTQEKGREAVMKS